MILTLHCMLQLLNFSPRSICSASSTLGVGPGSILRFSIPAYSHSCRCCPQLTATVKSWILTWSKLFGSNQQILGANISTHHAGGIFLVRNNWIKMSKIFGPKCPTCHQHHNLGRPHILVKDAKQSKTCFSLVRRMYWQFNFFKKFMNEYNPLKK